MNQILSWAEMLVILKSEGDLNDTSEDTNLLTWANEILAEIAGSTEHIRDFRIDQVTILANASTVDIDGFYIREIEQVYYQKFAAGVFVRRWDIREQHTPIYPAPIVGATDSYTVKQTNTTTTPRLTLTLYPIASGVVADKIQLIATVYPKIIDDTTLLPFVSLYPMLKRSVLQRLQMKRNLAPERIDTYKDGIARAATAAGISSKDNGDSNDT